MVHLQAIEAERGRMLLDELVLLHQDDLQVDEPGLAGDAEFGALGSQRSRRASQEEAAGR